MVPPNDNLKWHELFKQQNLWELLQHRPSTPQRVAFDDLVLQVALNNEHEWIVDLVLKHSIISHRIVLRLMTNQKYSALVNLCVRAKRPYFLKLNDKDLNK